MQHGRNAVKSYLFMTGPGLPSSMVGDDSDLGGVLIAGLHTKDLVRQNTKL